MQRLARTERKKLLRTLPPSQVAPPTHRKHIPKYVFWRVLTPVQPLFRELCMPVHTWRKRGRRQRFLLGTVAPDVSIEAFLAHVVSLGYRRYKVAWREPNQIVSLRLLVGFERQYHLRVYKDGEVRGHFEYTPEWYPLKHVRCIGMQERREDFIAQFGDRIQST